MLILPGVGQIQQPERRQLLRQPPLHLGLHPPAEPYALGIDSSLPSVTEEIQLELPAGVPDRALGRVSCGHECGFDHLVAQAEPPIADIAVISVGPGPKNDLTA
jgi:hypothetical protein